MPEEEIITEAVIFVTVLLLALGGVIISFVFFYQKKRFSHKQEVSQMQETFTKEMLHSKNEIQEQTLQHIAAEIHDNYNPTLSVININLAKVIPNVEDPVKEDIVNAKMLVKQLMKEMKTLSGSLNNNHVSRIGFVRAFEKFADHLRKAGIYNIVFTKTGTEFRLPSEKEIILLRMCQEILNNIVRHAHAKNITIDISYSPSSFRIEITDDGKGFDVAAISVDPEKQDSTGIKNLRNRAAVINAELEIRSQPNAGTRIFIELSK